MNRRTFCQRIGAIIGAVVVAPLLSQEALCGYKILYFKNVPYRFNSHTTGNSVYFVTHKFANRTLQPQFANAE